MSESIGYQILSQWYEPTGYKILLRPLYNYDWSVLTIFIIVVDRLGVAFCGHFISQLSESRRHGYGGRGHFSRRFHFLCGRDLQKNQSQAEDHAWLSFWQSGMEWLVCSLRIDQPDFEDRICNYAGRIDIQLVKLGWDFY